MGSRYCCWYNRRGRCPASCRINVQHSWSFAGEEGGAMAGSEGNSAKPGSNGAVRQTPHGQPAPSMDAPGDASISSNGSVHGGQVPASIRPVSGKVRAVLRLRALGQSPGAMAQGLRIGQNTARRYVGRAEAAGLGWLLPPDLGNEALDARLFPPSRPIPNHRSTSPTERKPLGRMRASQTTRSPATPSAELGRSPDEVLAPAPVSSAGRGYGATARSCRVPLGQRR